MNEDWLILIKLSGCFLGLFALGELLYHGFKVPAEITRKIVHIGTGLLTLTFPLLLQHLWQALVICSSFLLLLVVSKRFKLLQSINAIDRPSLGSILYPVAVIITFAYYQYQQLQASIFDNLLYFYMPVLLMAVCDPLAALAGTRYKKHHPQAPGKTWVGSLVFFVSAVILSAILFWSYRSDSGMAWLPVYVLGISLLTTLAEKYSEGGWDNFTIPIACIVFLTIIEMTR